MLFYNLLKIRLICFYFTLCYSCMTSRWKFNIEFIPSRDYVQLHLCTTAMQPLVAAKTLRNWPMALMLCCQTRGHKKYSQILSSESITFFIASWCLHVEFLDNWTLDVSRTASYEIIIVFLSVRPSRSFLKIGSLVFSDILHDDSWPWYLVTDETRFLGKKNKFAARIWVKIGPKTSFFAIFSSFVH